MSCRSLRLGRCSARFLWALPELEHVCRSSTGVFALGDPPGEWVRLWELLQEDIAGASLPRGADDVHRLREWFFDALNAVLVNAFQVLYPTYSLRGGLYVDPRALRSRRLGDAFCSLNGTACYRMGSLFNHSCDPNVAAGFPGRDGTVHFRTIREVRRHEQLCISYTNTAKDVRARRDTLARDYGFHCCCQRCLEEAAVPGVEADGWH
uniref:SET and MYND domain-containing protein n=1 Tax=Tetraselmis sp. GSL018 TaxID=582737 RepID=A0A061RK91_9CHLO|mmetsp:Transcript_29777/g.71003  ORF Transcript_29777/g.71003 Transcript_29777/m.71003 type:complete len:208 (-) Transcript_29777:470-1093(-)